MGRLLMLLAIPVAALFGKKIMGMFTGDSTPASNSIATTPAKETPVVAEPPLGGEVSRELLDILVCPEDKGSLELIEDGKYLFNSRKGYRYPIRDGIPIMLIEEGKKHKIAV